MESLRNFLTGPRLIFVVMVCAIPFVFLGTSSLSTVFTGSFGSINGEDVSETDIQIAANTAVKRFKNIYGEDFDFDSLDESIRSESIKQELIVQKVLQSGARNLGFINNVSNKEAQKGIIRSSQFQIDGVFDEDVYSAQVNSNGFTKEGYLETMTELFASEIYRDSLTRFNFVTEHEVFELTALLEQTTDITFTKINFEGLKNNIVNTLDELLSYYEDNQVLFYTDEKRGFKYFLLNQEDYRDSVQIPENYLEAAYSQYLERYEDISEIRFAHIMVDKNNYDDTQKAFSVIKSVEDKLLEGQDFALLASEYSEDLITKDIGGDLDYFEKDIFPIQFDEAIETLSLNEYSDIIELDDTYHILKIIEYNSQEPLPESQIKDELLNELIETESLALMNDDFSELENMLFENSSIEDIALEVTKDVKASDVYSEDNYNFEIIDSFIKDYLFASDTQKNETVAFELGDQVIFISLDRLEEPFLMGFDEVADDVADLLSESKAIEKISLLQNEYISNGDLDDKDSIVDTYAYVTTESYVDVKRYSSLLPNEVLQKIFNETSGTTLNIDANNGDKFIVSINSFAKPSEEEIREIISEYTAYGEERFSSKMQQIINKDVFQSAKVNLNDLIQF
jgi:parvulin-like peptidyl-prolyl isomerase